MDHDEALNRLAAIGQISAGIAHEIRNPLTAVKGFLNLLQESAPHAYLDVACSELDNAIHTIQNLLDVSKPDLDSEPYVEFSICSELESILYLFQDNMYRIQVEKNFHNPDVLIFGKRNQLKKCFFNILKNSFEAIHDIGKIKLEHFRLGDSVYVTIQDSGVGIPEEHLRMLGTPFFTTKNDGTGMGLTQVFSTLHQHGATVDVKSEEGKGTTFSIIFPIQVKEYTGVVQVNMQTKEGQSFKEFFNLNQELFDELWMQEAKNYFQEVGSDTQDSVLAAHQLVHAIIDDRQYEVIALAKERGRLAAKNDIPVVLKLEYLQGIHKVYWLFLYNYYKSQQIAFDIEKFFELERKTNFLLDMYFNHFFSSFTEYKDEILKSHREMIDDLSAPVIPLSDSFAVLPVIGTVDTHRAKRIQERVLVQISKLKADKIVLDLSGVVYMDTAVVGHLFKIIDAISLLGCKAILSGIRSEIANTMIELGVSVPQDIAVTRTLQEAIRQFGLD